MPSPNGSTPVFGFPYLLETDAPDVATASEDLALAIEADLYPRPSGTAYASTGATVSPGFEAVTLAGAVNLKAGMTFTSSSGSGLEVPVAGIYLVTGNVKLEVLSASHIVTLMFGKNNTLYAYGNSLYAVSATGYFPTVIGSCHIVCAANDVINLAYQSDATGLPFQIDGSQESNFVSAVLVSQ